MEVGGGETVEQIAARLDAKSAYAPLRGTGMVILFLALWSIDLWVFKRARLDISCIYPAKLLVQHQASFHPPSCTPRKVGIMSLALFATLVFSTLFWSEVLGGAVATSLLLFYSLLILAYMHPIDPTMPFRDLCLFVARVLFLVFVPGEEVHFLEVLVGDILTSLSKVFQEAGLVMLSISHDVGFGDYLPFYHDLLPASMASIPFISQWGSKGSVAMRHDWSLATFIGVAPLLACLLRSLRIHQCWVSYRNAPTPRARISNVLNIIKYLSSLPGIWLPILLAPRLPIPDIERLLLWALLINSIYSFSWDILMDWGLGHLHGVRHTGLRPTLLFARPMVYYVAMMADLVLRLVWALKYLEFDHQVSYDKFMLLIEVLEVVRRSMWAVFRVEWECLNKNFGALAKDARDSEEEEEGEEHSALVDDHR